MKIKNSNILYNEGLVSNYPVSLFIEIEKDSDKSYSDLYNAIVCGISNIVFYGDIIDCLDEFIWLNPRLVADGIFISTVVNLDMYDEAQRLVNPKFGYMTNQFILIASKFDNRTWMNILKNNFSGISSLIINHSNPIVLNNVCSALVSHEISLNRIFYNTNLISDKIILSSNRKYLYPLKSIIEVINAHPLQTTDMGGSTRESDSKEVSEVTEA